MLLGDGGHSDLDLSLRRGTDRAASVSAGF